MLNVPGLSPALISCGKIRETHTTRKNLEVCFVYNTVYGYSSCVELNPEEEYVTNTVF